MAVAVSLPWSTSATGILIVLWFIAVVPDPRRRIGAARRDDAGRRLAGAAVGARRARHAVGRCRAGASASAALAAFHKLLVIPLLLAQFRRSERGNWVVIGFLGSALVLLVVSWGLVLTPGLYVARQGQPGVPVKNYILQSGIFAICAFGLLAQAASSGARDGGGGSGPGLGSGAVHRQYLSMWSTGAHHSCGDGGDAAAVRPVVIRLEGRARRAGSSAPCSRALMWVSSPYLRARVSCRRGAGADVRRQRRRHAGRVAARILEANRSTSSREAPLIGHGTGTIPQLFRRDATPETIPSLITTNPHNQILTVAIQLGLVGTVALIAMWIAHLALFRDATLVAWFGLVLVTENIVSSLFNSHLFDFSQGWLYVFGVGVTGGVVLRGATTQPGGKP